MNVLVVAPHPDDECIGCGGTVCRHVQRGDTVHAAFLTSGELGLKHLSRDLAWQTRENEARAAAKVLQLSSIEFLRCADWTLENEIPLAAQKLEPFLQRLKPDLIYLPHANEWHPDHKVALPIVRAALNAAQSTPILRGYEVWTPMGEHHHVEDISDVMPTKLRALRKHRSQIAQLDYARAVRALNEFRGAMSGTCRYAEVFQNIELP